MPDVKRDLRGEPRFTKLALGAGSEKPWRIYGGFGNVIEDPKADFVLNRGGFTLNTRHVGVDYQNGMSLAIASDFFPDRMVCKPSEKLFTLEAHNDVTFILTPSSLNAFMAAKEYGRIAGFKSSPGLEELLGRQCLDQWGGDYQSAASDAKMAAKYGLDHSIFVKHVWQRWGYDYRLPEIYPPMGGVEPFKLLSDTCQENGIIFAPHDNYIDFYPDAEGFSYNHIIFNADGTPQRAWYNKGREAQSYRWLPHAFKPWLVKNMELIRDNIGAHGLFIDVFSAIPPMDYYDRDGRFYDSKRTAKEWSDAFDTCREILWKNKGPMLSECGHDGLIGSLDGGQADHYSGNRWGGENGKWERVPWHDIVSHGKFVLLGGGLGSRYAEKDPAPSGYGSDNYNGTTVIGGRNPMSDGPFSIAAVKTYWMLHDVCDWLAHHKFNSFEFEVRDPKVGENMKIRKDNKHLYTTIHRLHSVFGEGDETAEIWCNRGADDWELPGEIVMRPDEIEAYVNPTIIEVLEDDEIVNLVEEKEDDKKAETKKMEKTLPKWILPEFGYYVKTPEITAYVAKKNDKTIGFCRKDGCVFYDARPDYTSILSKQNITATVNSLKKISDFVFEMNVTWNFEVGAKVEKAAQFIHVTHPSSHQGESILYYGTVEKTDLDHRKAGIYHSTIKVALPENAPDGEHKILFGIFDPQTGGRLGVTSLRMEGSRVYGGTIEVKRDDDGKVTTTVTKSVDNDNHDTLEAPMVDFDGVKTNVVFDVGGNIVCTDGSDEAYLEFDGTNTRGHYVLTDYILTKDSRVDVDFSLWNTKPNSTSSPAQRIFDQSTANRSNCILARLYINSAWGWSVMYGDNHASAPGGIVTVPIDNNRLKFTIDSYNSRLAVTNAGVEVYNQAITTSRTWETGVTNLWIGGSYGGATAAASMRLYSFRIYKKGVLDRNYVPCVRNGTAGLYETCGNKFLQVLGGKLSGATLKGEAFQIAPQPAKLTSSSGRNTATLTCLAAGAQSYEWYEDGVLLSGETSDALTLNWTREEPHVRTYSVIPVYTVFNETVKGDPVTAEVEYAPKGITIIIR